MNDDRLAAPLQRHRDYDMPASPRMGGAAALRVYRSEGPGRLVLQEVGTPHSELLDREPDIPPHRLMELPRR